jgi:hypothetical protein
MNGEQQVKIFLSHRHEDADTVLVLKNKLEELSANKLSCFQTSAPGVVRAGEDWRNRIKLELKNADALFLIFTNPSRSWDWSLHEAGLFSDLGESNERMVVCICATEGGEPPSPLAYRQFVQATPKGIAEFMTELFTRDNFFYGRPAINERINMDTITDFSKELSIALCRRAGPLKERPRWDYLRVRLAAEETKRIEEADGQDAGVKLAKETIPSKGRVAFAFGQALSHFGFTDLSPDMTFGKLVNRWENESQDHKSLQWVDGLYQEMTRAIRNSPAQPTWHLMKSVREDTNWWFAPIINHVRVLPEYVEFDLYLFRLPVDQAGQVFIAPLEPQGTA